MKVKTISELIQVRNYLSSAVNGLDVKLSKEDVSKLNKMIPFLDRIIVQSALSMDLADFIKEKDQVE